MKREYILEATSQTINDEDVENKHLTIENASKCITDENDEIRHLSENDFKRAVSGKQISEAKKQTTIRLKTSTIIYFQGIANETGIPYQTLINMYLDDCANKKMVPNLSWHQDC